MAPTHHTPLAAGARASRAAVFSYGFRPFFAGAALMAVLSMSLWLVVLAAPSAAAWLGPQPHVWHAHEMVFGFAMAAVGGFLLTAVPNWTGALPTSGRPLEILFALWLVGRAAMLGSAVLPPVVVAALDIAFVPALALIATRQLMIKPQPRNLMFAVLLTTVTAANVHFHAIASGLIAGDPLAGVRLGLAVVVLMIVIVGGRIVPAFTHNYLHLNAVAGGFPVRNARLDVAAMASAALALLAWGTGVSGTGVALLMLAAAALNGTRLALWRGIATRDAPIVWMLHLGYAWVVIGMLLAALAQLSGAVSPMAATHAFGAGAAGTMIVAVMSRASLGHTGRRLVAAPMTVASYWLVTLSAALRIAAATVASSVSHSLMLAAGLAWIAAFVLFARVYLPILTTPRLGGERRAG